MKIQKIPGLLIAAVCALSLASCAIDGTANDGSQAEERLSHGYEEKPTDNSNAENGGYAFFTGCFIWADGGPNNLTLNFSDTTISAWTPGSWGGFGLGQITESGDAFVASSDLTPLATVEFDVVAGVAGTCKIQVGDGAEQNLSVTTTKTHKTISVSGLGLSNYILIFNGINIFNSEEKKIEITNLVFKDSAGNKITRFETGSVIPE